MARKKKSHILRNAIIIGVFISLLIGIFLFYQQEQQILFSGHQVFIEDEDTLYSYHGELGLERSKYTQWYNGITYQCTPPQNLFEELGLNNPLPSEKTFSYLNNNYKVGITGRRKDKLIELKKSK